MNFSDSQNQEIYNFIMRYNTDEEFKNKVQEEYLNSPNKLSILQIYALEDILRFGNNELFKDFLEAKGNIKEEQMVDQFNSFVKLYYEDENFKHYKLEQLKNQPETLSNMELYILARIIKVKTSFAEIPKESTENIYEEPKKIEYDPFNPILYGNEAQIRETLTNLLFGQFIHEVLELPEMLPIKLRQKSPGMIANIDKSTIISSVQVAMNGSLEQTAQVIEDRVHLAMMKAKAGFRENTFKEYLKYNTNISAREILNYYDRTSGPRRV